MAAKYKKRSDGRYLSQVQIGIGANGKSKYKSIYAHTIKELEEKVSTFRQEFENGLIIDDKGLTVAVWCSKWLDTYKCNVEMNTRQLYENTINVHIIPILGHYTLKQLRPHHVQDLINRRVKDGLTRTVQLIKMTLCQILEQAIENGYVNRNVAARVALPVMEKPLKRSLTTEEKKYMLNCELLLKEKAFIYTLLYTGLRRGEALALTRGDVDLINRTIDVNKTIIFEVNKSAIKESPKTASGNRTVPIIDELFPLLQELLLKGTSNYVFPSAKGELMSKSTFTRMWARIKNAFNISAGGTNEKPQVNKIADDITPHIFRHTYATMLYYADVDIKTAQYLLGHSSIKVTMDIYTHLDNSQTTNAAEKLNNFLSSVAVNA